MRKDLHDEFQTPGEAGKELSTSRSGRLYLQRKRPPEVSGQTLNGPQIRSADGAMNRRFPIRKSNIIRPVPYEMQEAKRLQACTVLLQLTADSFVA